MLKVHTLFKFVNLSLPKLLVGIVILGPDVQFNIYLLIAHMDLSCALKTVRILISWLHKQSADQDI